MEKVPKFPVFFVVAFFAVIFVGMVLIWGLCIVSYDEFALEKEFGVLKDGIKPTGFNWVGLGSLIRVNNQVRNYQITVTGASSDKQDVNMIVNLNIRIKEDKVFDFVKAYTSEESYQSYLNNKVQEKIKSILIDYKADEVLDRRLEISKQLFESVKDIKELEYFEFKDLSITDIRFSEQFTDILERKARVSIERDILERQKENLELLKKNMAVVDIDTYFKYQLIEKWDGKSNLIISDALLR